MESLLERLRARDRGLLPPTGEEPRRTLASIAAHLRRLLNARQGHAASAPNDGLPDLTHFLRGCPATVSDMEALLRSVVVQQEPRLTDVQVRYESGAEDEMDLRFELRARLRQNGAPVVLETRVGMDGHVAVEGGTV
jgi:type VI secretion system lysozyme-like protein